MSYSEKVSVTTIPVQLQEGELLQQILTYALENEYSFALWRLPNDQSTNLIVSFTLSTFLKDNVLEELPEGFLFAPFDNEKDGQFLKADLSFVFKDGRIQEPINPTQVYSHNKLIEISSLSGFKKTKFYSGKGSNVKNSTSRQSFEQLIQKGINEIESD